MQTRLGGVGACNSPEACSTGWGRGVCRPGEGLEDAKPGRGRRGAGRQRKDSQPQGREFAKWRKAALISRKVWGAVKSHEVGCKPPRVLAQPGRTLLNVEQHWEWACQPRQGRAKQARRAMPGEGGGHCWWPGPTQAGVPARQAQSTLRGEGTCRWIGVLTSRAQHLEQLEVLHAYLLLVPRQVGCGHRGQMNPASA